MSMAPILYKYCDSRGIDILRNQRLKVTPFDQFNDPFELLPRMRPELSRDDAHGVVRDPEIRLGMYEQAFVEGSFTGTRELFEQMLDTFQEPLAKQLAADYPRDAAQFRDTHQATIATEFGLICLAAARDSLLMWSHYTKGHSGFVIGFDMNNAFFTAGPPIHEVVYADERVLMGHYGDQRDRGRIGQQVAELIKRKSTCWAYEHEWRQAHLLAGCITEPDLLRQNRPLYYKPIGQAAIVEVVIGCRADYGSIQDVLVQPGFEHVAVFRAKPHESEFKLVIEPEAGR
jgi:Protein of unknown function (DUF2971)